MITIAKKYFRHSNLHLICALVTLGFTIYSTDKSDPPKVVFSIERTEGLDEAVEAYWNDQLRLNPKEYATNLKHLKTRIYQG